MTQYEAFYLLYDPPATPCQTGNSYVIRVATSGATQRVLMVEKLANIRATGMNVVGGGADIAITHGGDEAMVSTVLDNVAGGMAHRPSKLESWKEIPET